MRCSICVNPRYIFSLCLVLLPSFAPSTVLADAPAEALGPAKILEMVQPYVRPHTEAVVHADMARVDLKAVHDLLSAGIVAARLSPDDEKDANEGTEEFFKTSGTWIADFRKAGGRNVFILASNAENNRGEVVIAPLEAGANARAIQGLLFSGKADGPADNADVLKNNPQMASYIQRAVVVGDAVVLGTQAAIDSISKGKPADRPELAAALEPAGDAPARIAVILTQQTRTQIEGFLGNTLPIFLGGGPTTSLTRDVLWVSLSAQVPPNSSLSLCAQCRDAASATAANNALSAGLKFLSILPSQTNQPNWAALTKGLAPTAQDTRIVLNVDAAGIENAMPALAMSMAQARKQARMVQSMSNMRQLLMGCVMYAQANHGDWPDNLDVVVTKYLGGNQRVMQDPKHPDVKSPYTYVKPGKDQATRKAGQTVVLYESADEKAKDLSTGFADGHVEHLTRERFEKMLLDTQSGNTDNGL